MRSPTRRVNRTGIVLRWKSAFSLLPNERRRDDKHTLVRSAFGSHQNGRIALTKRRSARSRGGRKAPRSQRDLDRRDRSPVPDRSSPARRSAVRRDDARACGLAPCRLKFLTTLTLNPSSASGGDANIDSKSRSSASLIRSAMLMIFDVKTIPDLLFTTKYHGFHCANRHICCVTNLTMG